ncbi:oxidoreductase [Aspergillus sclerotioniger CBS 115572]|uniref:Oxidoreductase n=1 Tax=Aspergillus sclerotioniger CBS 115572 TaxID=1450535 RepID=A0A317X2Y9_9EURO|nr:oxidoreductase [Aspergillus sclerotioniger CBS 115572]PWY92989.1 oxidoreductase [Aspergillus sclerotioniger CBS 115572]
MSLAPPVIDFTPFHAGSNQDRQRLVEEIRSACEELGFFQLRNHGISPDLQTDILEQSRDFFSLPVEIKEKYDRDNDGFNRGYERLRAQNFEKRAHGDLKEGFFLGRHLPLDDPDVQAGKFGQGPNKYPAEVTDPLRFRDTVDRYYGAVLNLAVNLMTVIAEMVGLDPEALDRFCDRPIATLRLLHYPPQPPDASELERGIGAHSDFGAITILLQDSIGGLQVWDRASNGWVDVVPVPGAVVVNTGNLMMRWTNDRYISNLHRVINRSGLDRYSIPFFFDGNADFLVECLESCRGPGQKAKYGPITVNDWMVGRYADTFGDDEKEGAKDPVDLQ